MRRGEKFNSSVYITEHGDRCLEYDILFIIFGFFASLGLAGVGYGIKIQRDASREFNDHLSKAEEFEKRRMEQCEKLFKRIIEKPKNKSISYYEQLKRIEKCLKRVKEPSLTLLNKKDLEMKFGNRIITYSIYLSLIWFLVAFSYQFLDILRLPFIFLFLFIVGLLSVFLAKILWTYYKEIIKLTEAFDRIKFDGIGVKTIVINNIETDKVGEE